MEHEISLKLSLIIIIIVGVIFSLTIIFLPVKNKISTQNIVSAEQVNLEFPFRLKIPTINVNSTFEYVGLTSLGAMDVPKNPSNVAWFDLGPRPGEKGSAVIAGHSGWKDGTKVVFDNLYKLQKGDKIYVENKEGVAVVFIVREIKSYNSKADTTDVFNSKDGKVHLNLITCSGIWDEIKQSHSDRLVVFSDKEEII